MDVEAENIRKNADRFVEALSLLGADIAAAAALLTAEQQASVKDIKATRDRLMFTLPDSVLIPQISLTIDPESLFLRLCGHSVYSCRETIAQGYIPQPGGHRAGLCGTAVIENGVITGMRDISTVCLRIAREYPGCAENIYDTALQSDGMLIGGVPCSGKTTILRDLSRLISREHSVAVVDTRGEIAACCRGVPQLDVGRSLVLDSYPKTEGIVQAVRCLSPEFVICDELGGAAELEALANCVNTGVKVIASVHAAAPEQLLSRPNLSALIKLGAFSTIVMLEGSGRNIGRIRSVIETSELKEVS